MYACSNKCRWTLPLVVFGMRLVGMTCATSRPVWLVYQALDRRGGRQKIRHAAAMEHEHHQFLALGAGLATPAATSLLRSNPGARCAMFSRS